VVPVDREVWALTIDEDGIYQLLGVSIETGAVVWQFPYGVSPQPRPGLWQHNGLTPLAPRLLTSHARGEVTCLLRRSV
jgi:hypothetical protein